MRQDREPVALQRAREVLGRPYARRQRARPTGAARAARGACAVRLTSRAGHENYEAELPPTDPVPPEKPPDRGAETLLPARAAVDPVVGLRLVTALPVPVPPARPLTAVCTPVMRWVGGFAVSDALPPVTRGIVPEPAVPAGWFTTIVRGGS